MSQSISTCSTALQQATGDTQLESFLDFAEYDDFQSPSLSPTPQKALLVRATSIKPEARQGTLAPSPQSLNGPSHNYELYKQQTGIVPGALASTLAVNQQNSQVSGYNPYTRLDYLGISNPDELFDFNTAPSQASMASPDMDMDFEAPESSQFFFDSTVDPSNIGGQNASGLPSPPNMTTSNVGRMWPGMHQQAALAKAQQQQRQQQQMMQQQQQQQQQRQNVEHLKPPASRSKAAQSSDPIVEQKITQLLKSMRAQPSNADDMQNMPMMNLPKLKKDEDDMDDDERLLASEEGKKLSSKERRQLRNKVSARAFRSRRKEYITQLEAEIASKVNENGDLRAHNRALQDENKRLSDLTRMLLSSPSFSDFLNQLSANPQQLSQAQQQTSQHQQQPQQTRSTPKDINPYTVQQQQQQVGMATLPEQGMDLSMLRLDPTDSFNFQPQVYAVLETPMVPIIDTTLLTGKTSNFVGDHFGPNEEKAEMPTIIERPEVKQKVVGNDTLPVVDEDFENDPAYALYHNSPPSSLSDVADEEFDVDFLLNIDVFTGIQSEKTFARLQLINQPQECQIPEDDKAVDFAIMRIQLISARLESAMERLERLTADH